MAASAEGAGVGRRLMEAAEAWARGQGSCAVPGYAEEEVRLTKVLGDGSWTAARADRPEWPPRSRGGKPARVGAIGVPTGRPER